MICKILAMLISINMVCMLTACAGNASSAKVKDFISVSAGENSTLAIKSDKSLWMYHSNSSEKIMDDVESAAVKKGYFLAVKTDGSLWFWGGGTYLGAFGSEETWSFSEPIYIMNGVKTADVTDRHLVVLKTDGSLWLFESREETLMFASAEEVRARMVKIAEQVKDVSCAASFILMQNQDDGLYVIKPSDDSQTQKEYVPEKIAEEILSFSTYSTEGGLSGNVAIIKKDQTLWTRDAGDNPSWNFVKVMDHVIAVSGGRGFSMAIKTDGSLWAWGVNSCGQIGDGTSDIYTPIGDVKEDHSKDTPVKVLDGVKAVSCGDDFTMAIKTDGSLWAWGANREGQLCVVENPDIYGNQKIPAKVIE